MNRTDRQKYKDSNLDEALALGYDVIQCKYDGWWARIVCEGGKANVYTRTQRLVLTLPIDPTINCTLIGEYLFGTQWAQNPNLLGQIHLFDCWADRGSDLSLETYRNRFAITAALRAQLPDQVFKIVENFHIATYPDIWKTFVESGRFEGVVFRKRTSIVDDTILRCKRRVTKDLRAIRFIAGEGKHIDRLGAVVGLSEDGVEISVGGGFSDAQRDEIWEDQEVYRGRIFEIEGYAEFQSGSLRHPQFIRWRDDK